MQPGGKHSAPDFLRTQSYRQRRERKTYLLLAAVMLPYSYLAGFAMGGAQAGLKLALLFGLPLVLAVMVLRWAQQKLKKLPFLLALAGHASLYTLLLTGSLFAVAAVMPRRGSQVPLVEWVAQRGAWLYPAFFLWVLLIVGIQGVARKLGPGVFWNWIRGYYHHPRVETRIFMFLDMKDSTGLAERLGDEAFSSLLRDFMIDLGDPLHATRGEVSHYVGDEAVLTWRMKHGLHNGQCVQLFFRFAEVLKEREEHYRSQYGIVPGFKAGLHSGRVVATEVGELKSEIVYHGDVLNTTARIQGACSELQCDLLLSKTVADQLPSLRWLELESVGAVALKGKSEAVELFCARLKLDS